MKVIIIFLSLLFTKSVSAQSTSRLFGTWEGKINVGISLRLVFIFANNGTGKITGTSYSPDQGNQPIPCSEIIVRSDSAFFSIESLKVTFAGNFKNDTLISGVLTQGKNFDLTLSKVLKVSALLRPQTPRPPYPYISENIEYDNADKTLHYGATMTIPKGNGPFPSVLLITGSGAQNRDEEIFE
ncbi:MAG: hypothetical protein ABI834_08835, partial [Ginsengibacter sp.]